MTSQATYNVYGEGKIEAVERAIEVARDMDPELSESAAVAAVARGFLKHIEECPERPEAAGSGREAEVETLANALLTAVTPEGAESGAEALVEIAAAYTDFETIGDRVDASRRTLKEHYDTPTPQEKRDRQLEWVDKV